MRLFCGGEFYQKHPQLPKKATKKPSLLGKRLGFREIRLNEG